MLETSARRTFAPLALATLAGCGGEIATTAEQSPELTVPIGVVIDVKPACADPAPLTGAFDARAPGYIVVLNDGSAVDATTDRLAASYHFTTRFRYYSALHGFATLDATPEAIAALRCDAAVRSVEHNGNVRAD